MNDKIITAAVIFGWGFVFLTMATLVAVLINLTTKGACCL
jgi:hypothetical protein